MTASNRDPKEAVSEDALRQDLLYRRNVFPVHLLPLRARADDVIGPEMNSFVAVRDERIHLGPQGLHAVAACE